MAIQKMENGRWKINVYIGSDVPRYIAYADSKHDAEIEEAEAKLKKLKGEIKKRKGDYTFEEVYKTWWAKKYTITRHHEPTTLERTESAFRLQILPYLGKTKIKNVSYDLLEDTQIIWAFGDKEKGMKPYASYKKLVAYTKQVMKYALLKGYIEKNPYDFLEMPVNEELKRKKEERRQKKYYPVEVVKQSLELTKQHYGMQEYVLLALTYYLGAAKGKIYPLAWSDVDFDKQTISMTHKSVIDENTGKRVRQKGMKIITATGLSLSAILSATSSNAGKKNNVITWQGLEFTQENINCFSPIPPKKAN